jgi:hypothetical protein
LLRIDPHVPSPLLAAALGAIATPVAAQMMQSES